jgi:hypothetical protein
MVVELTVIGKAVLVVDEVVLLEVVVEDGEGCCLSVVVVEDGEGCCLSVVVVEDEDGTCVVDVEVEEGSCP